MNLLLGLNGEPILDRVDARFVGVGMIRGEYLCRLSNAYVTERACRELIHDYLVKIARIFAPDPVWYRLIEMETSEANTFRAVDHVVQEKTTMLGLRGIRRGLRFPDAFALELEVAAQVAAEWRNLHILLPYVHDASQCESVQRRLDDLGFDNKLGIMAEIPAAILCIRDFVALGIDNVTVGLNDLTSLTLGAYRGSGYDRSDHPAIIRLLEMTRRDVSGDCRLAIAGYLSAETLSIASRIGFDAAVVHYSKMRGTLADVDNELPFAVDLDEIKRQVTRRVNSNGNH